MRLVRAASPRNISFTRESDCWPATRTSPSGTNWRSGAGERAAVNHQWLATASPPLSGRPEPPRSRRVMGRAIVAGESQAAGYWGSRAHHAKATNIAAR